MSDFLNAFKPPKVTVNIETDYGATHTLTLQLLTVAEYNNIGAMVADAVPPRTKGMNSQPNLLDPKYRAEQARVEEKRTLMRLADALSRGGNNLGGGTLEQMAERLRDLDAGIVETLRSVLMKAVFAGKGEVSSLAGERFRQLDTDRHAHLSDNGTELAMVDES